MYVYVRIFMHDKCTLFSPRNEFSGTVQKQLQDSLDTQAQRLLFTPFDLKIFFQYIRGQFYFRYLSACRTSKRKKELIDKTNGPLLPFPIDNFGWHYIVQRSKRNNLFRGDLYARSFQLTFLMISHCDKQIMLINLR